jgi:5-methylcytosine-specific restriction endonuclease McrA
MPDRMVEPILKGTGFAKPKARRSLNPLGRRGRERRAAMAETRIEGECRAQLEVCTGWAQHRHHIRRRSQGGSDDTSNLLLCCNACHTWIHANPREARTAGFLRYGVDTWSSDD